MTPLISNVTQIPLVQTGLINVLKLAYRIIKIYQTRFILFDQIYINILKMFCKSFFLIKSIVHFDFANTCIHVPFYL